MRCAMKERFTVEIANVMLNILSDEKEEFIKEIVAKVDEEIRTVTVQNKRCSTTDAAILCALDYYAEKMKAEKRIKNLEAQLALYDTNLRRLKNENNTLQASLEGKAPAAPTPTPSPAKVAQPVSEPRPAAKAEPAKEAAESQSSSGKLRQLELLLQDMKK